MIFQIVCLVLIIGITFINSIWGFFSGIINAFCCVVAAVVAFTFSDVATDVMSGSFGMSANYASAASVALLYFFTLGILRTLADTYIRGNVRIPMYADWGGGAICAFVIAMVSVGTMATSFLMLPWGGYVMGFHRYERTEEVENGFTKFKRVSLWIPADDFTEGLVRTLSGGSMRGATTLASVYPNYMDWVFYSGNNIQHESMIAPGRKDGDGFKEGVTIDSYWLQKDPIPAKEARYRKKEANEENSNPPFEQTEYKAPAGKKALGFRISLNGAAADRDKYSRLHRMRPSMLRLVGKVGSGDRARPAHYIPRVMRGIQKDLEGFYRIVDLDNNISMAAEEAQFDVFFEVDDDFEPAFIEYRRYSRKAVPGSLAKGPPTEKLKVFWAALEEEEKKKNESEGIANTISDAFDGEMCGDRNELPMDFNIEAVRDFEEGRDDSDRAIAKGNFAGEYEALKPVDGKARIKKLARPEGKRLIFLKARTKKAMSLYGQSLNFVAGTVNQYRVLDDKGTEHYMVGYFAYAKRNADQIIEFKLYKPDDPANRSMLDLQNISRDELAKDDNYVIMFFAVDKNRKIRKLISNGGTIDIERLGVESRD